MARPARLSVDNSRQSLALYHLKRLDPRLALKLLHWYTISYQTEMRHRNRDGTTVSIDQTYTAVDHGSLSKLWKRISSFKDPMRRHQLLTAEVRRLDHISKATHDPQLLDAR